MIPKLTMEEPQVVRAKGDSGSPKGLVASKLLMQTCICRMPWHDPEMEVDSGGYHRNMLSALLTTPLVHCKQQSLGSHKAEAKTLEAKLSPVSRNNYHIHSQETYSESIYIIK